MCLYIVYPKTFLPTTKNDLVMVWHAFIRWIAHVRIVDDNDDVERRRRRRRRFDYDVNLRPSCSVLCTPCAPVEENRYLFSVCCLCVVICSFIFGICVMFSLHTYLVDWDKQKSWYREKRKKEEMKKNNNTITRHGIVRVSKRASSSWKKKVKMGEFVNV